MVFKLFYLQPWIYSQSDEKFLIMWRREVMSFLPMSTAAALATVTMMMGEKVCEREKGESNFLLSENEKNLNYKIQFSVSVRAGKVHNRIQIKNRFLEPPPRWTKASCSKLTRRTKSFVKQSLRFCWRKTRSTRKSCRSGVTRLCSCAWTSCRSWTSPTNSSWRAASINETELDWARTARASWTPTTTTSQRFDGITTSCTASFLFTLWCCKNLQFANEFLISSNINRIFSPHKQVYFSVSSNYHFSFNRAICFSFHTKTRFARFSNVIATWR